MPAGETLRSRAYRAYSRLGPQRVGALGRAPGGTALLGQVDRVLAQGTVTVAAGLGRGLKLDAATLPPRHAQMFGLVRGSLEPEVQEALRRTVTRGGCVWDVGANLGFFALLAARLTGPSGSVHAIEALPANAQAIRDNAAHNGMAHVHVLEAAANDVGGRGAFLEVAEGSWSHLADRGHHAQTVGTIEVDVVAVDELIAAGRLPPPDVLKLDVEGSEVAVLDGARETLEKHRPILIVELHETNAEVLERLAAAGYTAENLEGPQPLLDAGPVHLLARPR